VFTLTLTIGTEGVAVSAIVGVNVIVGGIDAVIVGRGVGIAAPGGACPLAAKVKATEVAIELLTFGTSVGCTGAVKIQAVVNNNAALRISKIFFFTILAPF
jgi:hypothetical protein